MILTARTDFVVPLDCREDLARTPDLPACGDLDLTYRRLPCQLREPADTRALYAVAAVSGNIEVINGNATFSAPLNSLYRYHEVFIISVSRLSNR